MAWGLPGDRLGVRWTERQRAYVICCRRSASACEELRGRGTLPRGGAGVPPAIPRAPSLAVSPRACRCCLPGRWAGRARTGCPPPVPEAPLWWRQNHLNLVRNWGDVVARVRCVQEGHSPLLVTLHALLLGF